MCSTYEVINQEARESWRLLRAGILVRIDRRLSPARRAALRYWENDSAPANAAGAADPLASRCAGPGLEASARAHPRPVSLCHVGGGGAGGGMLGAWVGAWAGSSRL